MINYNYLSCTDYDGKTKEINFCSENLPESASEEFEVLVVHTDKENKNLLHVKSVEHLQEDTLYYNVGKITIKPSVSISSSTTLTAADIFIYFTFTSKEPWPSNNTKQFKNFKAWIEEHLLLNNHLGVEVLPNAVTLPATGAIQGTKKSDNAKMQCVPLSLAFQSSDICINFAAISETSGVSNLFVFYNLDTLDASGVNAYISIESYTIKK
jgi:hypothetical protein